MSQFNDYGAESWGEYLQELDKSDEDTEFSPLLKPSEEDVTR